MPSARNVLTSPYMGCLIALMIMPLLQLALAVAPSAEEAENSLQRRKEVVAISHSLPTLAVQVRQRQAQHQRNEAGAPPAACHCRQASLQLSPRRRAGGVDPDPVVRVAGGPVGVVVHLPPAVEGPDPPMGASKLAARHKEAVRK